MQIKYDAKYTVVDSEQKPIQCACGEPSARVALVRGGMWASCEECYKKNPESGTFLPSGPANNPIAYNLVG